MSCPRAPTPPKSGEIDQPLDAAATEGHMPFPTPAPGWVEGTRAIVEKFKAYVDAFEMDENLAREGMLMSKINSVNDKAPVQHLGIKTLDLKESYYEGALIRDTLYTVEDKAELVRKVVHAVKPYCQIVNPDLVRASESTGPKMKSWMAAEPAEVHTWSVDQAQQCLSSLNVLTRIAADESDDYRARVFGGWSDFLHRIETRPLGRDLIVPLVNEAELWARRIAAIDSGISGISASSASRKSDPAVSR